MSNHSDDETTFLTLNNAKELSSISLLDDRINKNNKKFLFSLILALGNASDAVEIMCVGYIINELDEEITTSDKGHF